MKVTQIISDTNIGGGGKAMLNYLEHCDREHFVPSVILPQKSALTPLIEKLDIPFIEIDAMADKSYDPSAKKPLSKALKEFSPDLVHTHGSLTGRMVAKNQRRKILYTKHCAFAPTGIKATSVGKFLVSTLDKSLSNGVIAVGHSAKENLVASGISSKRIHTMYNGVSPLTALSAEERDKLRESYGFAPTDFVVGILARVEEYKGHFTLFNAAKILLAENIPIKLLVVGEGSYLPFLEKQAETFPKDPHTQKNTVHFAGFVSDVEKPLSAMDVQVNASFESETSCLSLIEGMSMGLPAVASELGGNPYLIRHEINGLLFEKQNEVELAKHLKALYEDKELYETCRKGASKMFLHEFTGEQYAKNIEKVYETLIGRK